jgi:hypothetical protein
LFAGPPVLLMTWTMVPTPPRETITMLVNRTPDHVVTSKLRSATMDELTLKLQ